MMLARTLRRFVLLVTAAATAACAAAAGSASAGPRHDRNTISADELKETQASTLYDVVQRIHPEWLVPHTQGTVGVPGSAVSGSGSDTDIQVFLDTQHAGGLEVLKQFTPTQAAQLKFYSSSEAQARFGNGNLNGVIQIVTMAKR
ncbi:MAG TPA: hypothetical protein VHB25_16255 [Gemmatimonadaceae bacterium]|nr:hypothetical protein [Gemmatimonadaceae bacterium]